MPPESPTPDHEDFSEELDRLERYYSEEFLPSNPWSTLRPRAYLYLRQRQRRVRQTMLECGFDTPERIRQLEILDVGSGGGTNIAWLIELGADPARCSGIDLLPQRVEAARARIPNVRWLAGDMTRADLGGPFDFVMLLAVLTSVTQARLKQRIVDRCFSVLKPGGVLFFYDVMSRRETPGTADYKPLTYSETAAYFSGRPTRWFRRDLLEEALAERITRRLGVTAAELVQATGLFNMDASFAYVRA